MSSAGGCYSWANTTDEEKAVGIGLKASNDVAELAFGYLTYNIERSSMISLTNSGGVAMATQNGDFKLPLVHTTNKKKVCFNNHLVLLLTLRI